MQMFSGNNQTLANPLTFLSQFFTSLFAFFVELFSFTKRFEKNTTKKTADGDDNG